MNELLEDGNRFWCLLNELLKARHLEAIESIMMDIMVTVVFLIIGNTY